MFAENAEVKDTIVRNKSKTKKLVCLVALLFVVLLAVGVLFTADGRNYNKAIGLYENGEYNSAYELFERLEDYNDSLTYAEKCSFYIQVDEYTRLEDYSDAVNYIQENSGIFTDEGEYKSLLDEYKYFLAQQQYTSKRYVDAYDNLIDNSYNKASLLVEEIEPLYNSEKAVDDILETYQWMSDYLDKMLDGDYKTDALLLSTGVEWDMFYINRGAVITNLLKDLKSESIDEYSDDIKDIIGYVPETKEECEKILSELQKVFITRGGFKDYNGYFLYFVMCYIIDSDYVTVTRNDSEAIITINQVDKYLKEKNVSAKTFAYMLGVPQMYSMELEKESECLKFTFSAFSHNYSYCFVNDNDEKDAEIDTFIANAESEMTYLYTSGGYDYFEMDLSGISKYNLDYLRLVFACSDVDDQAVILSQDNHLLNKDELKQDIVKIIVKYDKNAVYYGYYFMADYS